MTRLRTNIAYNFIYQLLILFLPLVTAPYLARVIGAEGIGVFTYSYSIATYFVYFIMLGLNNYGNRVIASCQEDKKQRSLQFWSIYAMQAFCFALVGISYVFYVFVISNDIIIAAIQGLYVLSALFDINWFFFGMELFKLTVIRNAVIKIITTISIFIFVRSPSDTVTYVFIMCLSYLASQICLWPFLRKYICLEKPTQSQIFSHIKPNLVLFIPVIAVSIYNILSKIILGCIAGEAEVGFYESAVKITSVPIALVVAIGTVMLPHTSALFSKEEYEKANAHTDKTMIIIMAFTSAAAFGIALISEPFTTLFYGPGFGVTAQVLIILAFTIPLLGFGNVIRTQYLIPNKRDSVFLVSALCGAIVNLATNFALIPLLGAVGAAIASLLAEIAVLLYQLVRIRKEIPLTRYTSYALLFIAAGMSTAFVSFLIGFTNDNIWIDLFGKSAIFISIYAIFAFFTLAVLKRINPKVVHPH